MSRTDTLRLASLILPALLLLATLCCPSSAFAENTSAATAFAEGRTDDAIRILRAQLQSSPHDATSHQLLCRAFYSEELTDSAIHECEAATSNAPSDSDNFLWLGRAYGLKASRANPISAFTLARKVVAAFEHAVQLDPSNVAALRDLGEYYVGAPGIVGGGLDKAQQLATRIMSVSPAKGHRLRALIAEKRDDTSTAEAEFKHAVDAQRSPESYVDLADFYQRRKQYDQSYAAVQAAIRLDRAKDASLVDAASVLTSINREPQLARQLLTQYLQSPARSDNAPAARVHVQLGDLLLKSGDTAHAQSEYEAALTLASKYAPAHKALQALQAKAVR